MSDISHQISDIRYVFDSSLFRLSDIREANPVSLRSPAPPREGTSGYSARMSVFLLPVFVFLYNKIRIPIDYPLRKIVQ